VFWQDEEQEDDGPDILSMVRRNAFGPAAT